MLTAVDSSSPSCGIHTARSKVVLGVDLPSLSRLLALRSSFITPRLSLLVGLAFCSGELFSVTILQLCGISGATEHLAAWLPHGRSAHSVEHQPRFAACLVVLLVFLNWSWTWLLSQRVQPPQTRGIMLVPVHQGGQQAMSCWTVSQLYGRQPRSGLVDGAVTPRATSPARA